jgi:hypothetical protein
MATFEGKAQRSDCEIDVLECDFRRLAIDFVRLASDFTVQLSVVRRMSELTADVSGLKNANLAVSTSTEYKKFPGEDHGLMILDLFSWTIRK